MLIKIRILLIFTLFLLSTVAKSQITFIIESLPSTTPEEDTIYIAGNFNGWSTSNVRYMLHQQVNGIYSITLPIDTGRFEYKFVRGNWLTVETNEHNEYMPNRIFTPGDGNKVHVKIYNWLDKNPESRLNFIIFYFFALGLFGVVLLVLAIRVKDRHRLTSQAFFLLNLLLVITLFGGTVYQQSNPIWQSQIAMFGYLLLYLWGPALEFSLHAVRFQKINEKHWQTYIPFLLVLVINLLQFSNFKYIRFFSRPINSYLNLGNSLEILIGITVVLYFHLKARNLVLVNDEGQIKYEKENRLVNLIFFVSIGALSILALNFILLILQVSWTILSSFQLVIVVLSAIILIELYFYWKYPNLLRDKSQVDQIAAQISAPTEKTVNPSASVIDPQRERQSIININNAEQLVQQLSLLMVQKKPFKNPDLNIADLSDMLNSKPHILSRLVNEHYNKNFRDFINEYRVNEFVALSVSDAYKNYTFLALAYEVGFNSKSTFNLAFKKVKGLSPSEYLKQNYNVIKDPDANL